MTVKVTPGGTRGLRLPRFIARLGNRMMLRSFRRGGARTQGGVATLMLETVGARSGQPRHPKYRTKTDREIAIVRLRRRDR